MSKVSISGSQTGTAQFTIQAPATNTNRTLSLPDVDGTIKLTSASDAFLNAVQTFTASQRGTVTTDNDLSFDMSVTNNFSCTVSGAGTLTFTNITAGQSGFIYLSNPSAYTISKASAVKCGASMLATISAAGTYLLNYFSPDGTSVYVTASGALS